MELEEIVRELSIKVGSYVQFKTNNSFIYHGTILKITPEYLVIDEDQEGHIIQSGSDIAKIRVIS